MNVSDRKTCPTPTGTPGRRPRPWTIVSPPTSPGPGRMWTLSFWFSKKSFCFETGEWTFGSILLLLSFPLRI